MDQDNEIRLGDRVRDRITGFQGIVVGITAYLYMCNRPIVQPEGLTPDGKQIESLSFDEPQLEIIERGVIAATDPRLDRELAASAAREKTGGSRDTPTRPTTPRR